MVARYLVPIVISVLLVIPVNMTAGQRGTRDSNQSTSTSLVLTIKLFVSDEVSSLDTATCQVDDFGQPARLEVMSWDGDHQFKFDIPTGMEATATFDNGNKHRGCYYEFDVELPQTSGYEFSLLGIQLERVNFRILENLKNGANLYLLSDERGEVPSDDSEPPVSQSEKPLEPIAYVPQADRVTQIGLVAKSPAAGSPLLLVITSYEFVDATSASDAFQGMCDEAAAYFISTGDTAHWADTGIEGDQTCAVQNGTGATAIVFVRHDWHVLSFMSGGLDIDAITAIETIVAGYPYDPTVAIPSSSDIPGSWDPQKKSVGDVTEYSHIPHEDRP